MTCEGKFAILLYMKKAVCIVVKCASCGRYLGVSRKDNHNSFGLIGGKVDPEDATPEEAARRELKEETGLTAGNLILADERTWGDKYVYYYLAENVEGRIHTDEETLEHGEGIIRWVHDTELFRGYFGDYNVTVIPEVERKHDGNKRRSGILCGRWN